jgi:hypothetical protein
MERKYWSDEVPLLIEHDRFVSRLHSQIQSDGIHETPFHTSMTNDLWLGGHQSAHLVPRSSPTAGEDIHPSLQLMRGLARKPPPMFLIGSPEQEEGNLSSGAAQLPSGD